MGFPDWFFASARALVRADSVSAAGNGAALAVLEPLYARAGLPVRRFAWRESIDGAPESSHANLLAGPAGLDAGAAWASPADREAIARGEVPASARGGVLLVTHSDTVPPGPLERWTETGGDPRALTERDGALFGLGAADVKLDALCKIAAAERLRGRKLTRPFWLCATAAEEVGLRGARRLAEGEFFRAMQVREVLCGEPSELQLIRAHKGYAVVVCTLTDAGAPAVPGASCAALEFAGRAAHSSTPHLGDNAIHRALAWAAASGAPILAARGGASANTVAAQCTLEVPGTLEAPGARAAPGAIEAKSRPGALGSSEAPTAHHAAAPPPPSSRAGSGQPDRPDLSRALRAIAALEELWRSLLSELRPAADARFDPAGAVGGLNVLESVPGQAGRPARAVLRATMDARLLPTHDPEALLASFRPAAQALVETLGGGALSLHVEVVRNAGGMSLEDGSPLVEKISRTLRRLGLDGAPRAKPTSTEAGVFARAGCQAVVLGPGRSTGNAHTANERIEISQLERAIDLYEALLVDLCCSGDAPGRGDPGPAGARS